MTVELDTPIKEKY